MSLEILTSRTPYSYSSCIGKSWWWILGASIASFIFLLNHRTYIATCNCICLHCQSIQTKHHSRWGEYLGGLPYINTFRSPTKLHCWSYNLNVHTQFSKSELSVGLLVPFDHYSAKSIDKVKGTKHTDW
jgi:hypothetical protein